jgi:hypothetical protein
VRQLFPLFNVPWAVAHDLRNRGISLREVTPATVRRQLRNQGLSTRDRNTPGLALELLVFCLGDATADEVRLHGEAKDTSWMTF